MSDDLSQRAGTLLRTLVALHIRDGQPVGSRTLREEAGLPVSAATIRNVMSDLEDKGYLHSPHTSAGRVPTALGYRLFVDTLLSVKPLDASAMDTLRASGLAGGGPPPLSAADRQAFANVLDRYLSRAGDR